MLYLAKRIKTGLLLVMYNKSRKHTKNHIKKSRENSKIAVWNSKNITEERAEFTLLGQKLNAKKYNGSRRNIKISLKIAKFSEIMKFEI